MDELCVKLHQLFHEQPVFRFPFDTDSIPLNGVYVLFETGETGHGGDRIVQVGTHTGNNQLRSRLKQHFVNENKDRSIFRKNIGRALLNRDQDPFLAHWELDLTTREAKRRYSSTIDFVKQSEVESRVTDCIRDKFHFVAFGVNEKVERSALKAKIISTVSRCQICAPSPTWLGIHSPKDKIRKSGLWLVNELHGTPLSEDDFVNLGSLITRLC